MKQALDLGHLRTEGLRTALSAINLSSIIANDDINTDWHQWKDTFLVAVSDCIQTKWL